MCVCDTRDLFLNLKIHASHLHGLHICERTQSAMSSWKHSNHIFLVYLSSLLLAVYLMNLSVSCSKSHCWWAANAIVATAAAAVFVVATTINAAASFSVSNLFKFVRLRGDHEDHVWFDMFACSLLPSLFVVAFGPSSISIVLWTFVTISFSFSQCFDFCSFVIWFYSIVIITIMMMMIFSTQQQTTTNHRLGCANHPKETRARERDQNCSKAIFDNHN